MNGIRNFLVFLTGHRINNNVPDEEIGSLANIGAAIAFATLLAGLQFGIAGWFLAVNLETHWQAWMSLICALIGASIVLVLDRSFIYLTDTRYDSNKKFSYLYLSIRIFLILVIGSLSSQFTMPLLLKSELAIHAQDLKNDRLKQAKEIFQAKYDLSEKISSLGSLQKRSEVVKNELINLTPDLIGQRTQATQCHTNYDKKFKESLASGRDESSAFNLLLRDKQQCERLDTLYRQALRAYTAPKEEELVQLKASITKMQDDINGARKNIESEVSKSSQLDEIYINAVSADVLSSLIRNNPGALLKYVLLTLLQLFLELMPILLKLQAGQSPLGRKVALYAYQNRTEMENELYRNKKIRMASNEEFMLSQIEHSMVQKELQAKSLLIETQIEADKLKQAVEAEKLQQELNELKHQSSFYSRIKNQFGAKSEFLPKSGVFELFTKPISVLENPKLRIVTEKDGPNYYMKVASINGSIIFTAFIRSGEQFIFPILVGSYIVKFAAGTVWYGTKLLFGQNTQYSQLKLPLTFEIEENQLKGHSVSLRFDIAQSPEREAISELDF